VVTPDGKVKMALLAILQHRQVPRNPREYDIVAPQWLIHWENMAATNATWEDVAFITATFADLKS
jgi:hypothetical protein